MSSKVSKHSAIVEEEVSVVLPTPRPESSNPSNKMSPGIAGLSGLQERSSDNDDVIRVLIVDDVTSNRKLLSMLLRRNTGVVCGESASAFDALKDIQKGTWKGDGLELRHHIYGPDHAMIERLDATALLRGYEEKICQGGSSLGERSSRSAGHSTSSPTLLSD